MKKTLFIFCSLALIGVISEGCRRLHHCLEGKGPVITSDLVVAPFSKIDIQGGIDVFVTQGESQKVQVTGQSNLIDRMATDVAGDRWIIKLKDHCIGSGDLAVYITVPDLSEAKINGSGDIDIGAFGDQQDLVLQVNGSGEIRFSQFTGTRNLNVSINGSGDVRGLAGFPDLQRLSVTISGSGAYDGFPVSAENAAVSVSGSGNVHTAATATLDVKISGSGDVYYKGHPSVSSKISGSGRIIHAN